MINCKVKIRGSGANQLLQLYNIFQMCLLYGAVFLVFLGMRLLEEAPVGLFITIGLTFQGQTETMVKIMLKIVEW